MKRLVIPFAWLLVTSVTTVAQDTLSFKMPRATVKLSPIYFFANTFELGIEAFNSDFNKSFNIDVGFRSGSLDYSDGNGFSTEIAYRKYVAPMVLRTRKTRHFYQGIYYSLFVRAETFKGELYYYSGSPADEGATRVNSIAPGFTLGLQKTLWQIVFMDVYFGGGIKMSDGGKPSDDYYYDPGITEPGYEGIFPKVGVKIGVGL
jgi:hypothetical protein